MVLILEQPKEGLIDLNPKHNLPVRELQFNGSLNLG